MPKNEFTQKALQVQEVLGHQAEGIGRTSGFTQRASKMTASCFVQTLVLGWMERPQASLNQLVQVSADLGVQISEAGLQHRFNDGAVQLLQTLVQKALALFHQHGQLPDRVLTQFSQVNIVDSSLIALPETLQALFPGSKHRTQPAELKLQLSYDYLSGSFNALEVLAGRTPDQNSPLPMQAAAPRSFTLLDLGFFKKRLFENLAQSGAYFISRLQTQTSVYAAGPEGEALDLLTLLPACPLEGELHVCLQARQRLPVRLIYQRLPEALVEQRRRKAKANARRRGDTCSQHHLAMLGWSLFITNTPVAWVSATQVRLLYRLRWQIELVFKLWKHQAKLDGVGQWRPQRVLCQFYARLLGLLLFHHTVADWRWRGQREMSLPKAFQVFQRFALRWLDAIALGWHGLASVLQALMRDFQRFALTTQRRKSPSTYQQLACSGA